MQIDFREYKEKYFPLKLIDLSRIYQNIKTTRDGNLIKTINFQVKSNWNIWKQNLQLEIEYQVSLYHQFPNHILQIIDWTAEIQQVSVIVYITYNCKSNAKSLNSFLNTSMISEQQRLQIAEQIIEIASILELSEVQHRNIKLNNFILIENKTYLTDFGSARTHYNHYIVNQHNNSIFKQYIYLITQLIILFNNSSNSEERQKQNETLFYSSPEIMEIITQDNIDFQESEWAQIFENEQYKKVILKRNDNWSISIILLQLLSFENQIPEDIKNFYGYDIAKFDQEIRKQAINPNFRLVTEIIKQLSFGKISALTCLENLKKQIPKNDQGNNQHKQIIKEDQNILNIQLKRQVQINTKVDYYYLSLAQLKQLQQINDQELSKKNDQNSQRQTKNQIQQYQIKNQENQAKEIVNDSKSFFLDENSIQIYSPKNNEEEQFRNGNMKQLCDYESSSFEDQKLIKLNNGSINSFNNNDQNLLLTLINDDNLIKNQNKQKQDQIHNYDQQKPSQLQVLTIDQDQVQKKDQIKTVTNLLKNQNKQYTVNQIFDQNISKSPKIVEQIQQQIPVQQHVKQNISSVQEIYQYQNNEPNQNLNYKIDKEQQQKQINIIPLNDQSQIIKKLDPKVEEQSQQQHVIEIKSPQMIKLQDSNSFHQIKDSKNQNEQEFTQAFQSNLILYQQEFPFEISHSQKDKMSQSIIEFIKDPQFQTANQIQEFDLNILQERKQKIQDRIMLQMIKNQQK